VRNAPENCFFSVTHFFFAKHLAVWKKKPIFAREFKTAIAYA